MNWMYTSWHELYLEISKWIYTKNGLKEKKRREKIEIHICCFIGAPWVQKAELTLAVHWKPKDIPAK